MALGATIAGVGVVAEVPSAGTSTLAVLGGAAVGAHGIDQIYAGLFGTQSVASQLGSHLGNEIGGPWGGVIGGVLGDIGPNLKSMLTGVAAGAKSLGGFFKSMREAGGLKELIAEMRNAKQLSALLKSGKLTEQELAEMLKNGEITLADLEAAGIKPPPPGVLVSKEEAAAAKAAKKVATTWQEHEELVSQALKDANPGKNIGKQVTLDVTNNATGETVRIRIDNLVPEGTAANPSYQMVDAKFSDVKDLANPSTNLSNTTTQNQSQAYSLVSSGQSVTVVPAGQNAVNAGLTPGMPITVNPSVQIHVNSPNGIVVREY